MGDQKFEQYMESLYENNPQIRSMRFREAVLNLESKASKSRAQQDSDRALACRMRRLVQAYYLYLQKEPLKSISPKTATPGLAAGIARGVSTAKDKALTK